MTQLDTSRPTALAAQERTWPALGTAVVAGIVLGVADLVLQQRLPYPWANLANSSAVWAVAAFALGASIRAGRPLAAVAGVLMLGVAVEAYYLWAILSLGDGRSTLWSSATQTWLLFAVAAGAVFGAAGSWFRTTSRWRAAFGLAFPVAVLLGEAGTEATRRGDPGLHPTSTALITTALAVVVLLAAGGSRRLVALTVVLSLPLAVLFLAAFRVVGLGL